MFGMGGGTCVDFCVGKRILKNNIDAEASTLRLNISAYCKKVLILYQLCILYSSYKTEDKIQNKYMI